MMRTVLIAGVVILSVFLVGAGPLGSATLATMTAHAAVAPGSGMLMLIGAGLLGVSRWWR